MTLLFIHVKYLLEVIFFLETISVHLEKCKHAAYNDQNLKSENLHVAPFTANNLKYNVCGKVAACIKEQISQTHFISKSYILQFSTLFN
ncbi:CLUMA_CG003014, isoform A [Clunio marinus]|uniref:CLUMA_CG003014, isoform A n=1 Tax=Clunio marinus TaxID=568069 RepID=A0A1J1HMH6_9DIPT|nr:CLUMA_CG003014, isoform A [Clunio marinus]